MVAWAVTGRGLATPLYLGGATAHLRLGAIANLREPPISEIMSTPLVTHFVGRGDRDHDAPQPAPTNKLPTTHFTPFEGVTTGSAAAIVTPGTAVEAVTAIAAVEAVSAFATVQAVVTIAAT